MAIQFTGISQSAQTLGWGWTLQGIKEAYGHGSLSEIKMVMDTMYVKSPYLASRNRKPFDRDMYDAIVKGKAPLFKTWFQKWSEGLFKAIAMTDQMVANAVWIGAYQKALHEGKNEVDAIMDADAILSITQGMGDNKDMSYAQQGWAYGDLGKAATMFQTFFSSTANLIWLANRQAIRDGRRGNYGKMLGGLFRANWNLFVLPASFSTLMWSGGDWPDDEDEWEELVQDFARDVIGNSVGGLPVIRELVGMFADTALGTGQPRFALSPIEAGIRSTANLVSSGGKVFTEDDDLKNISRVVRGLGPIVPGLPASQIATTLEGIDNWDDNEGFEKFYRLLIREPQ
jgi:hypothetical protein